MKYGILEKKFHHSPVRSQNNLEYDRKIEENKI